MCEYVSGYVDLEGNEFRVAPDMRSHAACEEYYGLIPDRWREWEWTGDDAGASLVVRVYEDDPHDAGWLKACILAKWPTRADLIAWVDANVPNARINGAVRTGGASAVVVVGDCGTAIAGYRGTATAGDRGTATAGDRGTATAGDRGTAIAGYRGTAIAGDYGHATAGYYGTATAGDRGTAIAGYRGTAIAGDRGTATAGDCGTATAGDCGTATAGVGGAMSILFYDGKKFRLAVAVVGENGIEPNVPYRVNEKGEWIEAKKETTNA